MQWLVALLLFESLLLLYAARANQSCTQLRNLAVVNMLCISLFPFKFITVGPFTSNLGNLWYATVFAVQVVAYDRCGWKSSKGLLKSVYVALFIFLGLVNLGAQVPSPPGLEGPLLQLVADRALRVTIASLLAFGGAQLCLIKAYAWLRAQGSSVVPCYLIAMTLGQIVDSLIFFPVAFEGWSRLVGLLLAGLALKILFGVTLIPAVYLAQRRVNCETGLKALITV